MRAEGFEFDIVSRYIAFYSDTEVEVRDIHNPDKKRHFQCNVKFVRKILGL